MTKHVVIYRREHSKDTGEEKRQFHSSFGPMPDHEAEKLADFINSGYEGSPLRSKFVAEVDDV